MDIRREFEKRIAKKVQEIADLERAISEAKAYMQALMDALKILPKDKESDEPTSTLRPGSDLALAAEFLKSSLTALHIDQILVGIGKPLTKENKASLGTSLGSYARRNMIFTRPMPNTFGLIALHETSRGEEPDDLPDGFGSDDAPEA